MDGGDGSRRLQPAGGPRQPSQFNTNAPVFVSRQQPNVYADVEFKDGIAINHGFLICRPVWPELHLVARFGPEHEKSLRNPLQEGQPKEVVGNTNPPSKVYPQQFMLQQQGMHSRYLIPTASSVHHAVYPGEYPLQEMVPPMEEYSHKTNPESGASDRRRRGPRSEETAASHNTEFSHLPQQPTFSEGIGSGRSLHQDTQEALGSVVSTRQQDTDGGHNEPKANNAPVVKDSSVTNEVPVVDNTKTEVATQPEEPLNTSSNLPKVTQKLTSLSVSNKGNIADATQASKKHTLQSVTPSATQSAKQPATQPVTESAKQSLQPSKNKKVVDDDGFTLVGSSRSTPNKPPVVEIPLKKVTSHVKPPPTVNETKPECSDSVSSKDAAGPSKAAPSVVRKKAKKPSKPVQLTPQQQMEKDREDEAAMQLSREIGINVEGRTLSLYEEKLAAYTDNQVYLRQYVRTRPLTAIAHVISPEETHIFQYYFVNKDKDWMSKKTDVEKILAARLQHHKQLAPSIMVLSLTVLLNNLNETVIQDVLALERKYKYFRLAEVYYCVRVFEKPVVRHELVEDAGHPSRRLIDKEEYSCDRLLAKQNEYVARQSARRMHAEESSDRPYKTAMERDSFIIWDQDKTEFREMADKAQLVKNYWSQYVAYYQDKDNGLPEDLRLLLTRFLLILLKGSNEEVLQFDAYFLEQAEKDMHQNPMLLHQEYFQMVFDFATET